MFGGSYHCISLCGAIGMCYKIHDAYKSLCSTLLQLDVLLIIHCTKCNIINVALQIIIIIIVLLYIIIILLYMCLNDRLSILPSLKWVGEIYVLNVFSKSCKKFKCTSNITDTTIIIPAAKTLFTPETGFVHLVT